MPKDKSKWPSTKAKRLLAALQRLGWEIKRQRGSHRTLTKPDCRNLSFSFHDGREVTPQQVAKIAKKTGLTLEDL